MSVDTPGITRRDLLKIGAVGVAGGASTISGLAKMAADAERAGAALLEAGGAPLADLRELALTSGAAGVREGSLTVAETELRLGGSAARLLAYNGQVAPELGARPGTVQRWRLLNASTARFYRLALDKHTMAVIGSDGGLLDRPRRVAELLLASRRARRHPRQGIDHAGRLSSTHPALLARRDDGMLGVWEID